MKSKSAVRRSGLLVVLASAIALSGCATLDRGDQGEIIGGVLGGVLGSQIGNGNGQTAAIIIGTMAGSMIGRQIGDNMDARDRVNTAGALNDARTGEGTTWVNPDNGARYTVTPTRTFEARNRPCREFEVDANLDGEPSTLNGTACLQYDGSWEIVS